MAVTEHDVPALPVAVRVEPDTVQPPVVEYEVEPAVPPDDVNASVDPKLIAEEDVIVTVACVAPVTVPQRKPMRSRMPPT